MYLYDDRSLPVSYVVRKFLSGPTMSGQDADVVVEALSWRRDLRSSYIRPMRSSPRVRHDSQDVPPAKQFSCQEDAENHDNEDAGLDAWLMAH